MEINNKNITEDFLLSILNTADCGYYNTDKTDSHLYFYPKGLNCTIKIPCIDSEHIDINFHFTKPDRFVNFSNGSAKTIPTFINQLFLKLEQQLNSSSGKYNEHIDDLNYLLSKVGDNKPFVQKQIKKQEQNKENIFIEHKNDNFNLTVNIGRTLFKYNTSITFRPIEPVIIDCFFEQTNNIGKSSMIKKVIPFFKIDEFPVISEYSHTSNSCNDIFSLTEQISKICPESAPLLSCLILNLSLDSKIDTGNKDRPKI